MTSLRGRPEAEHPTRGPVHLPQQRLTSSVALHLLPGALLTLFVVLAAPALGGALGLFVGIGVVIAPVELGYLALYARRTTGSWSPLRAVAYTRRVEWPRLVALAAALAAWFVLLLIPWTLLLDEWLADRVFGWMPDSITDMATGGTGGETPSGAGLVVMVVVLWLLNGVVGPVVEELYFRGHLLPRLARYGRGAPVINTALFSLYHFWSPWQLLVRFVGFLPIAWTAWRLQSVSVSIAAHVLVNTSFLAFLVVGLLAG